MNAALKVQGESAWCPRRDEAYIGVLVDDLVTMERWIRDQLHTTAGFSSSDAKETLFLPYSQFGSGIKSVIIRDMELGTDCSSCDVQE